MGFDTENKQVKLDHNNNKKKESWAHVAQNSQKIVTFLDLCGHEKYLKTTMFGLVGLMPDYAMIVIGANMGMKKMTKEHLGICLALQIPFFIVVTKIDLAPDEVYRDELGKIKKICESPQMKKLPNFIKEDSDVSMLAQSMPDRMICPVFSVSNVTGEGVDKLKEFMSHLKSRVQQSGQFGQATDPVEFTIDGFY